MSAGLTRDQIVAVAADMPAHDMTMKAVAERLGVNRKALHHHVSSVEVLRQLVARRVFGEQVERATASPLDADWATALRQWAATIRQACLATGEMIEHLRFDNAAGDPRLERVEELLTLLERAGFSLTEAGRVLLMASAVANESARQELLGAGALADRTDLIAHALDQHSVAGMERVRSLAAAGVVVSDARQFEWQLDVLVAGLRSALETGRT